MLLWHANIPGALGPIHSEAIIQLVLEVKWITTLFMSNADLIVSLHSHLPSL